MKLCPILIHLMNRHLKTVINHRNISLINPTFVHNTAYLTFQSHSRSEEISEAIICILFFFLTVCSPVYVHFLRVIKTKTVRNTPATHSSLFLFQKACTSGYTFRSFAESSSFFSRLFSSPPFLLYVVHITVCVIYKLSICLFVVFFLFFLCISYVFLYLFFFR